MTFSRIMLGTVQFGLSYGIANKTGQPSYESVVDILRTAFESGITSLDTSASYGTSEEVLGQALKELGKTQTAQVVTKIPPVPKDLSESRVADHIDQWLSQSFQRLKVERLAGVLFHFEGDAIYLPLLLKWVEKGDIAAAGVSLDSSGYPEDAKLAQAVQVPCNLFDHRFDSFISDAAERQVSVFTRSVYLQGLLLMPEEQIPVHLAELIPWRHKLAQFAGDAGISLAELAVRYLYSNKAITSVLTGVDNVEQLQENIRYSQCGPLPEDFLQDIRNTVPILPERLIRPFLWNKLF